MFIVAIFVVLIWLYTELKRFRHKIWGFFLIVLILLTVFGFAVSTKGHDLNLTNFDGIKTAGALYWSWLGGIFGNAKSLTSHATNLDWKGEEKEDEG